MSDSSIRSHSAGGTTHPLKRPIKPSVPLIISSQADAVERYLLDEASVMRQQNEALIEVTLSVEAQTKRTNGRVDQHSDDLAMFGRRLAATELWIAEVGRYRRWTAALVVGGLSVISPVVYGLIAHYLGRLLLK